MWLYERDDSGGRAWTRLRPLIKRSVKTDGTHAEAKYGACSALIEEAWRH